MAFLGVRWVPTKDTDQRVSEASTVDLAEVVRSVRAEGSQSLLRVYNQLNAGYVQAYQAHQAAEAQGGQSNEGVEKMFETMSESDKNLVLSAGKFYMEGDSRYHKMKNEMLPEIQKSLTTVYIPHLQLMQRKETSEKTLWQNHAALANAQATYDLWNFEHAMAVQQQAIVKEQLVVEERKQQWYQAGNERRLEEIRYANKEKRRQQALAKERRAAEAKDDRSSQSRSSRSRNDSAVVEENGGRRASFIPPRGRQEPEGEQRGGGGKEERRRGHHSSLRVPGQGDGNKDSSPRSSRSSSTGRSEGKSGRKKGSQSARVDGATWL